MNEFLFADELTPWETLLSSRGRGEKISGVNLLAMLEGEEEEIAEEAFALIDEKGLVLDLTGLPKAAGIGQAAVRLRREEALAASGLKIKDLEETDPLRLYLEELALVPAFGDEAVLAEETASGSEEAMMQLTNLGLSRVVEMALHMTGYGVLLLDLIQEGSLGLWQGISSYRGGDYPSHRDIAISNAMAKAVLMQARANGVGQKMRDAMSDYRAVDERLLSELGRNPSLEEIAVELHMNPEEAANVKKMMEDAYLLQQAEKSSQPPEPTPEDEQAVEDTAYFQMRQRIADLLSSLDEKDAKLLSLRFGLEKGLPMSPEEVGRALGLTPEEVTARETAALMKLREQ